MPTVFDIGSVKENKLIWCKTCFLCECEDGTIGVPIICDQENNKGFISDKQRSGDSVLIIISEEVYNL